MSSKRASNICLRIGQSYSDLKRYDEAITALTEAIELYPDNASAYEHRGHTYRAKYHSGDRNTEDLKRAIEDFDRARDLYLNEGPF